MSGRSASAAEGQSHSRTETALDTTRIALPLVGNTLTEPAADLTGGSQPPLPGRPDKRARFAEL